MKKILILLLLVLAFCNLSYSQFKIKAKDKFSQAQQKANTMAPDPVLYAITSSTSLDTTGKDISWLYYYYSSSLDTGIIVTTTFAGALLGVYGPNLPGVVVRLLTDNFVNSDVAILSAENAGGRQFRYTHSGVTITAMVYKLPLAPDTTRPYWTVIYRDSSNNFLPFVIDGITGSIISIGIRQISSIEPMQFSLSQNYPNPFNTMTVIKYALKKRSYVNLKLYDIKGKEIFKLVEQVQDIGEYEYRLDASNLSSGIYFYRLNVNGFTDVKKMLLLK
ncbi:MAG: T9SS type A sorting domain-containing protein [Ignavibacteria bacterium]